ncbi:MAG: NUDIX domain-containing protein [Flavobacteriales bacterium]|jgi:ADP-ribose pyrophosphatase YjhB (NUDIX family)|nr:MAG: NUDIX domain-containing protein [Flavobacteriales bacterium]
MFTIRVYGLLVQQGRALVSDELIKGHRITKFPGGGLEYGEGLRDCLLREIREEMGLEAQGLDHFYTTDFFQQSAFHAEPMQVVSIYFTFKVPDPGAIAVVQRPFEGISGSTDQEVFRWQPLHALAEEAVSLPIDRVVWRLMQDRMGG